MSTAGFIAMTPECSTDVLEEFRARNGTRPDLFRAPRYDTSADGSPNGVKRGGRVSVFGIAFKGLLEGMRAGCPRFRVLFRRAARYCPRSRRSDQFKRVG